MYVDMNKVWQITNEKPLFHPYVYMIECLYREAKRVDKEMACILEGFKAGGLEIDFGRVMDD